MAEMTLEKAETILSKLRQSAFNHGLTDVQIARKLHTAHGNGSMIFFMNSLIFLRFGTYKDWDLTVMFGFVLGFIGFGLYMFVQASRFDKIRKLFENHGPQNLCDLTSSPTCENPVATTQGP